MIVPTWLGEVPSHWSVQPLRSEFRREKTLGDGSGELLSVYRDYGVIPKASRDDNFNRASEDLSKYQRVAIGDLVVNKMKAWQGSLGVSAHEGIVSPAYFVYKSRGNLHRRYAHYLLRSKEYADHMASISAGIRPNQWDLDPLQFAVTPLLVPPVPEQRAIADYLDRETAQIDAFIEKNEELIGLLRERRVAAIASAVTRGLDGTAPMSESGVPWLGAIPAGWRAVRLKFVADSLPGYAFASESFVADEDATRLLRGVNVGVGQIVWQDVVSIVGVSREIGRRYSLRNGDLVVGMDRPVIREGLRIASVSPRDEGALLVQRVLRLRGYEVVNEFLEYSMAWGGFASYIEPDFTGVSVPHMSEQQVGNYVIALPPLDDQLRIVEHLQTRLQQIDAARRAAKAAIGLARERRAALISAAVTGKIDVGVAV